jgi:gluconolactonase
MTICRISLPFAAALALSSTLVVADDAKTHDVKVKDITMTVPESWKQQEPTNKLRLTQFVIPKSEGDKEPTELVVSSFAGGGVDQNLPRWTGEFASEGRGVKLTSGKAKQGEYILADVTGTHIGTAFARRPQPLEDARLLAIVLTVETGEGKQIYYLKMTGPKKSVTDAAEALRTAIGAKLKEEKEYKIEKE